MKTIEAGTADAKSTIAHVIPGNFSCAASAEVVIFKVGADLQDMNPHI